MYWAVVRFGFHLSFEALDFGADLLSLLSSSPFAGTSPRRPSGFQIPWDPVRPSASLRRCSILRMADLLLSSFRFLSLYAAESQVILVASLLPVFIAALAIAAFINGFWMSVGGYL